MAEVLDTGPPPRRRPRPRWVPVAVAVAVAAAAAVLAARSTPDRLEARPTPAPTADDSAEPLPPAVVSVAAGTRWLYALVAECAERSTLACSYGLHRRPVEGTGWTRLPLRTGPRVVGIAPSVQVTADDGVLVLETPVRSRIHASTDGGDTFTGHRLALGPAIARAPAGGLVTTGLCLDCGGGLVVLEPATGTLRPLATQPAFDGRPVRSVGQRGAVLWALAGDGATAAASAVSTDGGRTWRTAPLPLSAEALRLHVTPDGGAYVLASKRTVDGIERLTGLLRAAGPGGSWTRLPVTGPRSLLSAAVGPDGLLVVDSGGTVWRLEPAGFARLPDPGPARPGRLVAGPTGLLAAVPRGDIPDELVLTSADGGARWRTERVLG